MNAFRNDYCEVLGIDPPRVEELVDQTAATGYKLFVAALAAEGGPLTLAEAARRLSDAGYGDADDVDQALRRSRPDRPPVYRHGEFYHLDPFDQQTYRVLHDIGYIEWLSPHHRQLMAAVDRGHRDGVESRSTSTAAAGDEPELPGPDVPLTFDEVEGAWRRISLWSWSSLRIALCVLDAAGEPMAPQDVVERAGELCGSYHGLSADEPHFGRRNSAIEVLEDGRWSAVADHTSLRGAREAVRQQLENMKKQVPQRTQEEGAELRRLSAELRLSRQLEIAAMRRVLLRGAPRARPEVLVLLDLDMNKIRIMDDVRAEDVAAALAEYDVLVGEEIRPLLDGLGIPFGTRRLHELRPSQKSIQVGGRRKRMDVTLPLVLVGSCRIEPDWQTEDEYAAQLRDDDLDRVAACLVEEATDLADLYHYACLHRAVRVRHRDLDEWIPVPWLMWTDWTAVDWIRAARDANQPLEVVSGAPPDVLAPWRDSEWCSVYETGTYSPLRLVNHLRQIVPVADVQRLRGAIPGSWYAPMPREAAGPSTAVLDRASIAARSRPSDRAGARPVMRLEVELDLYGVAEGPVRTIELESQATFWDLHVAIQDAFGWEGHHLHVFLLAGPETGGTRRIGIPALDGFPGDPGTLPGWKVALGRTIDAEHPACEYNYDFGDDWRHRVFLESVHDAEPGVTYPRCVAGARACPPEDVGGPPGYRRFLDALADPTDDEHEMYRRWIGGPFDPDAFTVDEVEFSHPGLHWVRKFGIVE